MIDQFNDPIHRLRLLAADLPRYRAAGKTRRSVASMTVASVCPSYGLPGSALACSTNWPPGARALVVTMETLTPNSQGALALPLPMHLTSGAWKE
jgi:hypothetical protein